MKNNLISTTVYIVSGTCTVKKLSNITDFIGYSKHPVGQKDLE